MQRVCQGLGGPRAGAGAEMSEKSSKLGELSADPSRRAQGESEAPRCRTKSKMGGYRVLRDGQVIGFAGGQRASPPAVAADTCPQTRGAVPQVGGRSGRGSMDHGKVAVDCFATRGRAFGLRGLDGCLSTYAAC